MPDSSTGRKSQISMLARWEALQWTQRVFLLFAIFVLSLIWLGIAVEMYWLGLLPFGLFGLYIALTNYQLLFYGLLLTIPLSVEMYFGSLGTDLPTEPLMIGLSGIFLIDFLRNGASYDRRYFTHPLALLAYLHLGWIFFTTIFSQEIIASVKFFLAKTWYLGAFFFIAERFLRTPKDIDRAFSLIFWPLLFVAFQSVVRHAMIGFDFVDQFKTIKPFMRNHVSYAGILAVMVPWMIILYQRRKPTANKRLIFFGIGLFWLVAIYFSYTRAAYAALIIALGAAIVIRLKLLKPALFAAVIVMAFILNHLLSDNNYLDYAPNFETTVAHKQFDDLLAATTQLEDVSTMERAYRWVAGGHMIPYHPWLGWGPGNFVEFYKGYTVSSFTTYVSDNPERSGIHSYYLMTLVEQGYIGLLLLLIFLFGILIYGEQLYHRLHDPEKKNIVMAALTSMIVIYAFLLINDMLETDKMGSIFLLNLAVIVSISRFAAPNSKPTTKNQEKTLS